MSFLARMRTIKELEVAQRMEKAPLAALKRGLRKARHSFAAALKRGARGGRVSLIAEFKRSSPSRGGINPAADPAEFIRLYDRHADAISVLTDSNYFDGSIGLLRRARRLTRKPLLCKDFMLHEYQVFEARANGADAVLLIAGFVPREKLVKLRKTAESLGMDALVECDDEEGLADALASGAKVLGINNRDLDTLAEDSSGTQRLAAKIPRARRKRLLVVSESAISSRAQVDSLSGIADAALVGTAIMSSRVPEAKLKELAGKTLVKFCGITSVDDARLAVKLGADVIGLNFYPKSPRFITVSRAREIVDAVGGRAMCAGIFVNEPPERPGIVAREAGLDIIQLSGDENPAYARSFNAPVIKAIHVRGPESAEEAMNFDTAMIMLDAHVEGEYGGTGAGFSRVGIDFRKLRGNGKQLVFSGGLDAGNVKGIIKEFRPFMVDVCSGIEESPGRKSAAKMRAFMKAAAAPGTGAGR